MTAAAPVKHARHDVVVVGGGHNGLAAAAYLARAGRSVLLLERNAHLGGAAASQRAFPGVDARLSRWSYLVSLLPQQVADDLGLDVRLHRRRISSYTPQGDGGLLVDAGDPARTRASFAARPGGEATWAAWQRWGAGTARLARAIAPTLTRPLPTREEVQRAVGDDALWRAVVERPLGEAVEATFEDDLVRGVVLTDALIGTFASAHEASLRQNRCFLYHVIGRGTGDWDVPVGGMGRVSDALAAAARGAGAQLVTRAHVTAVDPAAGEVAWTDADGVEHGAGAGAVVAGCAPEVLDALLAAGGAAPSGRAAAGGAAEGSQLKVNVLLARLPRLRDGAVPVEDAFAGTLHVHEGYAELEAAHARAAAGALPALLPCETYCHSLSDSSILGNDLQAAGVHTLTLFGLHAPARLFRVDPDGARERALAAARAALDDVLAEPLDDVVLRDPEGRPCVEVATPLDLEHDLALPAGHIFHRDLSWPWAEDDDAPGSWGVETAHPRLVLGGAGARRGGGVSALGGHNAAMALLGR